MVSRDDDSRHAYLLLSALQRLLERSHLIGLLCHLILTLHIPVPHRISKITTHSLAVLPTQNAIYNRLAQKIMLPVHRT